MTLTSLLWTIRRHVSMTIYRWVTRIHAFVSLATLSSKDIQAFMDSYKAFDGDCTKSNNAYKEENIVDYYYVLNHLCALGNVEKMYIPPLMDKRFNLVENQILFERKMMSDIGLPPAPEGTTITNKENQGKKCLEIGCGRGRIALHTATATGAHVSGFNIESSQIANARSFAARMGMSDQTDYKVASLNDPFPYEDGAFDAAYNVQAFTYSKDYEALFKEIARILKPGAKFSYLDWVLLDNFDANNPKHKELVHNAMPILGAVNNPYYKDIENAMKKAGLEVILSKEASEDDVTQTPLIRAEGEQFKWIEVIAKTCLPDRFKKMLDRINMHAESLFEGSEKQLFTTSYQIVCQKPTK